MAPFNTRWVAGLPLPSWFGFAGALLAWGLALVSFHETGRVDWRVMGAGFLLVLLALAARTAGARR